MRALNGGFKRFLALLLLVQLAVLLFFGTQKKGMHFDELFSYFNTNNSAGRQAYDRSWVTSEEIRQDFYVKPGEQFNYSYVVKLQGYDVHPPVFYLLLHTLCSMMPGVYSVWQGLMLNILYALLTTAVLYRIALALHASSRVSFGLVLLTVLNPGIVSNVMFIRMYCLMTLWISLCVLLHIRMERRIAEQGTFRAVSARYLFGIGALSFLGFLTHYYFLVFLFFLEATFVVTAFCRMLGKGRRGAYELSRLLLYVGTLLLTGVLAVLCFPQSLGHVHSGYRGKEVQGYLLDVSDFGSRFRFFGGLLNRYVCGGALLPALAVLLLLALWALLHQRAEKKSAEQGEQDGSFGIFCRCILVPTAGYFLVTVKASLVGDPAMMRYQLPIYALLLFSYWYLWRLCAVAILDACKRKRDSEHPAERFLTRYGFQAILIVAAALLALLPVSGLFRNRVFYLYPEQEQMKEIAAQHADEVCIYLYNSEENKYFLWNDAEQLWLYDAVYFASAENTEAISDEKIKYADHLVVYVSTLNEQPDFSVYEDLVYRSNPNVHICEKLYDAVYATAYEFR